MPKRMSSTNLTLLAAGRFGRGKSFTLGQLAESCWQRWPEHFGFKGLDAHYPDTKAISNIVHSKRIRGLFKNLGGSPPRYQLSAEGWQWFHNLQIRSSNEPIPQEQTPLHPMQKTDAWRRYIANEKIECTHASKVFDIIDSSGLEPMTYILRLRENETETGKLIRNFVDYVYTRFGKYW